LLPSSSALGGSITLRNVGILTQYYAASQTGRPRREFPLSWKLQISAPCSISVLLTSWETKFHTHSR